MAKARQDKALDNIEKGLGVLKGLGEAMGENLSQQDVLLTEIDSKVGRCRAPGWQPSAFPTEQACASADGPGAQELENEQHEAQGVGD